MNTSPRPRVKIFKFTPILFPHVFLQKARFAIESGRPADAKIIGKGYNESLNEFWLHVESASFPQVEDGALIPDGYITIRTLQANEEKPARAFAWDGPSLPPMRQINLPGLGAIITDEKMQLRIGSNEAGETVVTFKKP